MSDAPQIRNLFIRRPIFSAVISIVIVLLGLFSLSRLPVESYPPLTPPEIQVQAVYPGATAQDVADAVAAPIEQQLSGMQGLLYFKSANSSDGVMNLSVFFDVSRNPDLAAVDVQNQIALAVQVTLADGSLLPAAGELNFADLALQPATGTLQLRAQLKNPQHILLPGQFVRVRLLGLKRPGAILVPQRAVQQGLGGAFVYVVGDSGKVAARDVVATSWDGGSWLIEQGLQPGDRVVVDGVQKVAPGQPARPVAYRPAADSAATEAQDSALIAPPAAPLRIRSRQ